MLTELITFLKSWIWDQSINSTEEDVTENRFMDRYSLNGRFQEAMRYHEFSNISAGQTAIVSRIAIQQSPYNSTQQRFVAIKNNTDACPICYEANNASSCRPSCCVHVFHTACLNRWAERESNCPVCRRSF